MITAEDVNDFLGDPFSKCMHDQGITPEYLAQKLKEELNATKTETFKATTRLFSEDGKIVSQAEEVIYSKPMVDWKTRQDARKDAHKLRNDYPPERSELTGADGSPFIPEITVRFIDVAADNSRS